MNTRFSYNLLQLFTKKRNDGFAVGLVTICGVIGLVIGAAMMVKGTNDQNQVISQKAKVQANNAAELAAERIKAKLLAAPIMALYRKSDWAAMIDANGVTQPSATATEDYVDSAGNTISASSIGIGQELTSQVSACGTSSGASSPNPVVKAAMGELYALATASTPTQLSGSNSDIEISVVDYQPSTEPGKLPNGKAVGRLTVEGRYKNGTSDAVTRYVLDVPINGTTTVSTPTSNAVPGLWIREGGVANGSEPTGLTASSSGNPLGNQSYNANILFNDCSSNVDDGYLAYMNNSSNGVLGSGYTAAKTDIAMPDIPDKPSIPSSNIFNSDITSSVTLPRSGDPTIAYDFDGNPSTADEQVYVYQVNGDIDLNGSTTLTVTPGNKVIIYLNGDIEKGTDIIHDCTGGACTPTDFRIYGEKTSGGELCMNGNNQTSAFILAPEYNAGSTGGANFSGSLWVKTWGKIPTCTASGNHVAITQTGTWATFPPSAGKFDIPWPTFASVEGFQQIAANATPSAPQPYTGSYVSVGQLDAGGSITSSSSSSSSSVASSSSSSSVASSSSSSSVASSSSSSSVATRPTNESDCEARGGNWNRNNGCLGDWQ
jgi:hypothetical protein